MNQEVVAYLTEDSEPPKTKKDLRSMKNDIFNCWNNSIVFPCLVFYIKKSVAEFCSS